MGEHTDVDVIAATNLKYKGEVVVILLRTPKLAFSDSDEFSCDFSVKGGGLNYQGQSIGIESMQSLILSIKKIGTYLEKSEDIDHSLIEWKSGPLEFPTFKDIY